MSEFLYAEATKYTKWDPNEETRSQMLHMIDQKDDAQLASLLNKRIAFGTAGLRGPMGVGYCRMNELVILQTVQGLIRYLQAQLGVEAVKRKGVVVGWDHRRFGSVSSVGMARITAAVCVTAGVKVHMLEGFVATPFVPFATTHLGAAAGIMVTASHNPKRDDGFKVYWGNGCQIIPPHDSGIATAIDANLAPWAGTGECTVPLGDSSEAGVRSFYWRMCSDSTALYATGGAAGAAGGALVVDATADVIASYYSTITAALKPNREANAATTLDVVYTAMHGVGYPWIQRAFELWGHRAVRAVPQQRDPDPEFSTVAFPNPEEKGALNEAMRFADANGTSTLIIANDPDADRLGVAEKQLDGSWRIFSGNEIGVMLGHRQMMRWKAENAGANAAVLASVVSSRMLKKVAVTEGLQYCDTLTGFKWLGNRSIELQQEGTPVLFSYEEALGFCIGSAVNDKDGLSAAAVFVEMGVDLAAKFSCAGGEAMRNRGMIATHLQSLYEKYGHFVSYNSYVISHDSAVTDAIFHRLRTSGGNDTPAGSGSYWNSAAGCRITAINDITKGYNSDPTDKSSLPCTPESHMIMYTFENGVSATLRTSGTEPKIKFYTEMAGVPGDARTRAEMETDLRTFIDAVVNEMLQPDVHGLKRA